MPDKIIRLSVSEAAKLFGVSTQTVRRALTAQLVNYVVVQNRYKISFESLVRWSQTNTHVRNKANTRGIGQFVDNWKIAKKKFSPNPAMFQQQNTKLPQPEADQPLTEITNSELPNPKHPAL